LVVSFSRTPHRRIVSTETNINCHKSSNFFSALDDSDDEGGAQVKKATGEKKKAGAGAKKKVEVVEPSKVDDK